MKLSDVKGARALDVVADCIAPAANIAKDEKAAAIFKRGEIPEGMTPNEAMMERLTENLPALLKGHKKDFIQILAAIQGIPAKKYEENLTVPQLLADCFELLTDEEFLKLFT